MRGILLAALTGVLVSACTSRQTYRGGSFEAGGQQAQTSEAAINEETDFKVPAERLENQKPAQPNVPPARKPGRIIPSEELPGHSGPELIRERRQNDLIRI
jgi:hypothetical protein